MGSHNRDRKDRYLGGIGSICGINCVGGFGGVGGVSGSGGNPPVGGVGGVGPAQHLAAHTFFGSAQYLQQSGEHPSVLKDRVTSPGGTAIAGLQALEAGGIRTVMVAAVEAACKRSRELGERLQGAQVG